LRKLLVALAIGVGAALIALAAGGLPFVKTVELKSYDWRMRATADPSAARDDIVLVDIDEQSIRALAPYFGRWPWPRLVHAHLFDLLARSRPKVVLYDILFGEPDRSKFAIGDDQWTGEQSDNELAASAKKVGSVVFVGDATEEASTSATPVSQSPALPSAPWIERRPRYNPPMPALRDVSRGAGHNLLALDADGVARRCIPFVRVGDTTIPALAVEGAIEALGLRTADVRFEADGFWLGERHVPLAASEAPTLDGGTRSVRRLPIAYRGVWPDQRRTYRTYSFVQLFQSEEQLLAGEKADVDPAAFAGKIVIVGATAAGLYDQKAVPFAQKMSGPEIHANIVDSILSGRFIQSASRSTSVLLTLGAAIGVASVAVLAGTWPGVIAALVLAGGLVLGLSSLFGRGTWVPLVEPLVAVTLAAFGGVIYQYVFEGREKRRVKRLFSRYVSKDVYQQLLASPDDAKLGGVRRNMSVFFSDIRGFTAVSERGSPEAIVTQLNQYFSAMVPIVFANRGTVDKFVGDMIMALYGAPLDDPDHADHAVETALAMAAELARLNSQWAAEGMPTLDIGIGINTGDMVAGNLGSESIMSYTVIGDNVNLGSRLESLTRNFQTRIIISEATRVALKGQYELRPLGEVTVKGKSVPVKVFEVAVPEPVSRVLNAYSPLAPAADKGKTAESPSKGQES
jgi:adenylate cyclase